MKVFSYICLGVLGLMLSASAVAQTVLTDFEPPKDSINTPDEPALLANMFPPVIYWGIYLLVGGI